MRSYERVRMKAWVKIIKMLGISSIAMLSCLLTAGTDRSPEPPKWLPDSSQATPERLKPSPGELTVEQAIEITWKFMDSIGFSRPNTIPRVARHSFSGPRPDPYSISYGSDALFTVDISQKAVTLFMNSRRDWERIDGNGPTGRLVIKDPINGKGFVRNIATKLGVPENYEYVEFKAFLNGDPTDSERHYAARVTAMLELLPYGRRMTSGAYRCELVVDPVDGAVMYFCKGGEWPYTIESHNVIIKEEDAEKKAQPYLKEYEIGPYEPVDTAHPFLNNKKIEKSVSLEFVCPNGRMGGIDYHPAEFPQRLRLAWVFRYAHREQAWIDAADGRLLGGTSRKWKQEAQRAKAKLKGWRPSAVDRISKISTISKGGARSKIRIATDPSSLALSPMNLGHCPQLLIAHRSIAAQTTVFRYHDLGV